MVKDGSTLPEAHSTGTFDADFFMRTLRVAQHAIDHALSGRETAVIASAITVTERALGVVHRYLRHAELTAEQRDEINRLVRAQTTSLHALRAR